MADNSGSKVSYFLVGLGIGALVGILFAPKSGEETREYLAQMKAVNMLNAKPKSFANARKTWWSEARPSLRARRKICPRP